MMKSSIIRTVNRAGVVRYTLDGQLHNDKGPAFISSHESRYYLYGVNMDKESWESYLNGRDAKRI